MNRFYGEDITKKTNENGLEDQRLSLQNSVQESAKVLRTVNVENNITEDSIIKTIVDKKTGKNKKRVISAIKLTSIITIASLMPGACTSDTILDARNQDLKTYKISGIGTNLSGSFNAINDKDVIVIDIDKVEEKKPTPTPVPPETISPTPISTPTPTSKEETSEQEPDSTKIDNKDAVIPIQPPVQTEDIKDDKDKTGGGEPIKPTNNEIQNIENDKNNKNQEKDNTKVDDSKLNNDDNTKVEQVVTPTPTPTVQPSTEPKASPTPTVQPKPTEKPAPTAMPEVKEKLIPTSQVTKADLARLQSYPWHCDQEPRYNYEQLKQDNPYLQDVYNRFLKLKEEKILDKNEKFISSIDLVYFTYGGCYIINGIYVKVDDDNNIMEKRDLQIIFSQGTWEDKNELVYVGYKFLSD